MGPGVSALGWDPGVSQISGLLFAQQPRFSNGSPQKLLIFSFSSFFYHKDRSENVQPLYPSEVSKVSK